MLQLKIILTPASHHLQRKVKCNNAQYNIFLPQENYCFIDILQDIVFQPQYELLISVLGKKKSEVSSFEEFYKVQQDSAKFFNQKVSFDLNDLSFKFLSQTDKVLIQLDKCKFADLMFIIHKTYDTYSAKLHSKFTRRIKKYLTESKRVQNQKQQIKKLIQLIKSDSTDEEPQILSKNESKKEEKKPSIKQEKKQAKKEVKKEIKQEQQKIKKNTIQLPKEDQKIQQNGNNEDENNESKQKIKVKNTQPVNQQSSNKHHNKHQGHHKHDNNNQEDWQDIKEQKINKRKEKNNRKKHDKFDLQEVKKETFLNADDNQDNDVQEQRHVKATKSKDSNNNRGVDNKKLFQKSKQKPKKDLRIFLGLNGDSDDGWRERYRVEKVPARIIQASQQKKQRWKPKEDQNSKPKRQKPSFQKKEKTFQQPKQIKAQKSQKKQQVSKEKVQKQPSPPSQSLPKIVKIPSQGNLQKIFSFPKDGKKFILQPNSEYKIKVNNNFWIIIQKNQLKIEKDKSGFIRSQKFQSNEDYFIEAQDLTITFDGLCNLEDGGTPFGTPKIVNFTGSDNQWFHLKELDVYAFV